MVQAVKVRVLLDSKEKQDVFRDIEVRSDQNFEDLHKCILDAFNFENNEMASFYMSNERWTREQEIPLVDMGEGSDTPSLVMSTTKIGEVIVQEKQKLIYIFDFFRMWTFLVEVEEINPVEKGADYPRVTLSYGDAPDQESKMPDDLFPSESFNPDEDF